MPKQNSRSGELDLFKLAFAFLIVVLHSSYLPGVKEAVFTGGSIGVEFFFLVSGYLMALSADRLLATEEPLALHVETGRFLKRKLATFYPYFIPTVLIAVVAKSLYLANGTTAGLGKNLGQCIVDLLLLNWSGLGSDCFNAPTWYLSAMLLSMAVIYPLLLKYRKTFSRIVCPLVAVFLLGYLIQKYGQLRTPGAWDGLFKKGMIRAFGEISLGVFCGEIAIELRKVSFTFFSRLLMTILEYGTVVGVILYSNQENPWGLDAPTVILLAVVVIIAGNNLGLLSGLWNRLPFMSKLGKFSMLLYLNHIYWVWIFGLMKLEMEYSKMLGLYVLCACCSAIVCWVAVDGIRFLFGKNCLNARRMFIKE